jgi:hypothetical protein
MSPNLKMKLKDPKFVKKVIKAFEEICDILGIDINDLKENHEK